MSKFPKVGGVRTMHLSFVECINNIIKSEVLTKNKAICFPHTLLRAGLRLSLADALLRSLRPSLPISQQEETDTDWRNNRETSLDGILDEQLSFWQNLMPIL